MLKRVQKRDGKEEAFRPYKIEDAIIKAFESENMPYDNGVYQAVMEKISQRQSAAVEDIQDMIEAMLFGFRYFEVKIGRAHV